MSREKEKQVKRKWTEEESSKIKAYAESVQGEIDWKIAHIVLNIPNTTPKQLRNHYMVILEGKPRPWTYEDLYQLFCLQERYGNHWIKMKEALNRSEGDIRNGYNSFKVLKEEVMRMTPQQRSKTVERVRGRKMQRTRVGGLSEPLINRDSELFTYFEENVQFLPDGSQVRVVYK